eukprot:102350-Chlamydomonas_euryale.AAC.1
MRSHIPPDRHVQPCVVAGCESTGQLDHWHGCTATPRCDTASTHRHGAASVSLAYNPNCSCTARVFYASFNLCVGV